MKQIPIKNILLLQKLDSFATNLYQMPHSFEALPKPDLTFATLKTLMADNSFVGYPEQKSISFRSFFSMEWENISSNTRSGISIP